MLLIYSDPSAQPDYESPEGQAEFQEWIRYSQELGESGALVKGDPLEAPETATTVRGAGGEIVHTDGPVQRGCRVRHSTTWTGRTSTAP